MMLRNTRSIAQLGWSSQLLATINAATRKWSQLCYNRGALLNTFVEVPMASRILTALSVGLGLAGMSFGQQAACKTVEVPVGVINANGEVFRGLAPEDFIGRLQKRSVTVKAVTYDDGPRRMLLVVDVNKKLSSDSRKAEDEMIKTLLANARPGDTFAIMPARGPGQDVKFTADPAGISQALGQAGEGKRGKEPGVLDTVMAGIEWFGTPQPGDAVVVIAANLEGNRKSNPKLVAKALEDSHIRMFGLALGPVQTRSSVASGTMTSTTSQGLAITTPGVGDFVYNTGDEHFFPLTSNSGGLVLGVMNGNSHRSYKIEDPRLLQEVRQKARSVSKMISAYYRMQIEPPQMAHPEDWSLTINEEIQKHARQMFVLYPRELGPC
jgi:hypothetical protein